MANTVKLAMFQNLLIFGFTTLNPLLLITNYGYKNKIISLFCLNVGSNLQVYYYEKKSEHTVY